MRSFEQLQTLFLAQQASVVGGGNPGFRPYQGAVPVPANSDAVLWNALNGLPGSGAILPQPGNSFFAAYARVINSLVATGNPLDPIAAAQRNLADWGAKPPAWAFGYKSMNDRLKVSGSIAFTFDPPDGGDDEFWGLWAGSEAASGIPAKFGNAALSAKIGARHLFLFAPVPGDWYTASAIASAYQHRSGAPWDPLSPVTWETTFGPGGTLTAVVLGLICVSDVTVAYTSQAGFNPPEQLAIAAGAGAGLWPYYLDGEAARTEVDFGGSGRLTASIGSDRSLAILLGGIVSPAASYFGGA